MGLRPGIVEYLEESILRAGSLRPGEALLLGVSGGQDSTAMLLALEALQARLDLRLTVGHVNHGLRGEESGADEAFVQALADERGLLVRVARVQVDPGPGLEVAARGARFAALRSMARETGAERIALAHTATDRAETVLMNVLRGCGLEGLAAMPAACDDLVRPLLAVTREDTEAYCAARGIEPRQDSTNRDENLLRNRLRLSLIPDLERDYRPGTSRALVRLAEIAEAELAWTDPLVGEALASVRTLRNDAVSLHRAGLVGLAQGLRYRVLRRAVADIRGGAQDLSFDHVQALETLVVEGRTGARAELPGCWAERTAEALALRAGRPREAAGFETSLTIPGEAETPAAGLRLRARVLAVDQCDPRARGPWTAHLDAAVAGRTLVLRAPRSGDRLQPLGSAGTKKLQDLLTDEKVPRAEREGVVVAATTEGQIVWVVGHRIAECAKVTVATHHVAELIAEPLL